MIKRIKILIATLTISGMIFIPLGIAMPIAVYAVPNTTPSLCNGVNLSVQNGSCDGQGASNAIDSIIKWVLNIFSVIVGIAAVIMIVVGGLKYTISGGDSARVSGAKDTILFAIVGLVVVALAQIIVHYVLANVQKGVGPGA